MRCVACNHNLNDFESTRKIIRDDDSVHYPDLCNNCFKFSGLSSNSIIERHDLAHEVDIDNSPEFDLEAFNEEHEYLEDR